MPGVTPVLDNITIAEVTKVFVGLGVGLTLLRKAWPWVRRFVVAVNDAIGEPERDGVTARPGIMARLGAIEASLAAKGDSIAALQEGMTQLTADVSKVRAEVETNGGKSLKDIVLALQKGMTEPATKPVVPSPRTSPEEPREDHH